MDYAAGDNASLYGGDLPSATSVEIFEKPPPSVKLESVDPDTTDATTKIADLLIVYSPPDYSYGTENKYFTLVEVYTGGKLFYAQADDVASETADGDDYDLSAIDGFDPNTEYEIRLFRGVDHDTLDADRSWTIFGVGSNIVRARTYPGYPEPDD